MTLGDVRGAPHLGLDGLASRPIAIHVIATPAATALYRHSCADVAARCCAVTDPPAEYLTTWVRTDLGRLEHDQALP